jgi:hypothetical protein
MVDEMEPPPEFEVPGDGGQVDAPEPASSPAGVSTGYYRNLAIGAVVLLLVCGAFIFFASRSGGSDSSSSSSDDTGYDDDVGTTVPDLTPEDLCVQELSDWMPWVTGPGSPIDAGAEWGMSSEEYQIIMGSWQVFKTNLYKVGKDQASNMAYDAVATGCSNMTHDYIPGHPPPG